MTPSSPDPPEQPVWDWLDAHGVPFRETTAWWVEHFGTRLAVGFDRRVCRQRHGKAVLARQRHGLEFETMFETGPAAAPCRLRTVVGDRRGEEADWEQAVASLVPHLGAGRRASTYEHRWEAGRARVSMDLRPPSLRRSPWWRRTRREPPGLSLWIEPGWAVDLSDDDHAALARSTRLAYGNRLETPRRMWPHHTPLAFVRRLSPDAPAAGLWLDAETGQVTLVGPTAMAVIPAGAVAAISIDTVLPAKGGGGCSLGLAFRERLRSGVAHTVPWQTPDTVWLLGAWGAAPGTFDAVAATLADRLDVPLHATQRYDV